MTTTDSFSTPQGRGTQSAMLVVIACVLVCAALKSAQMVFKPVVFAAFLAMLVQPSVSWLERFVPKAVAMVVSLSGVLAVVTGLWVVLVASVSSVVERGPFYVDRLVKLSEEILRPLERFGLPTSVTEVPIEQVANIGLDLLGASVVPIMATLGGSTLVAFMVVLMLLEVESFRVKIREGLRDEESVEFFATVHSVTRSFQKFFVVKTLISALTGLLSGLVTWALGIDFPFVWGLLTFLLNYIPNIGSMIAVIPPVAIALLQFDGPGRAVGALASLAAVQITIGNFLDPRWVGRSLSLSPVAVFVSMVFWGWMWGIPGVFLSVPLTILMKIAFEHVDGLRVVAIVMGGVDPKVRADASRTPIGDDEVAAALDQTAKHMAVDGPAG